MKTEKSGKKKHRGLMAIAALKLVEGTALLALGFGLLHFLNRDLAKDVAHWIDLLRGDPHSRYLIWLLEKVSKVDEHRLRELSAGTFTYSGVFLCEGVGLACGKRWAEWLTVATTALPMPLEVYEIFAHFTWPKVAVLIVNSIVVGYLITELRNRK